MVLFVLNVWILYVQIIHNSHIGVSAVIEMHACVLETINDDEKDLNDCNFYKHIEMTVKRVGKILMTQWWIGQVMKHKTLHADYDKCLLIPLFY